jgi:hypothetical protein
MARSGLIIVSKMLWFAVLPVLHGQQPAGPVMTPPSPVPVVGIPIPADSNEFRREINALEEGSCAGQRRDIYRTPPVTLRDFVGGSVKDIRVIRALSFNHAPVSEDFGAMVQKVWEGAFQFTSCHIPWDEGETWRIEAAIEFEDGKRSLLITDGMHVAVQDHNGKVWFFRLLPAAQ